MFKKISLFIFFSLSLSQIAFSQLGNNNMYLLANLNQHPSSSLYSAIWGYRATNGREYAILGCGNGTAFIDISDSSNIHEVDFQPGLTSSWREMKFHSHYCYIVSEASGSGLQIVDLQYLPDSVHLVSTYSFSGYTRTHTIQRSGPYLYLNGGDYMNGGVFVLDLTANPEAPVKRGEWETKYIHDCRVINDTIWACNIYSSDGGTVSVISAVNKDNLQSITSWPNNPNPGPHNCALTTDRRYCLVTDEINGNPRMLKIWNIQNLSNIILAATWQPMGITTSIVHNVEVYGYTAVVAHYTAGVRVVNITNPASPQEIAWYDTYPANNDFTYNGCWGVYQFRASGKIVASDRQTGLYVLKVGTITGIQGNEQVPSAFELEQNYPNPFNPSTTIKFSLPKGQHVNLTVYDMLGRQSALLIDEYQTAGEHSVNFDAANLASGIYLYKLTADEFTETKKMTLLK
jgi:choice-of-anchor B domain-containing protein